ncbi:N-terminal domain of NEFA-interacting nuclear protein NIP30-domain-containing protein [Umbelopsis sp. AD052]|nr:N-terminal domain of NEFA-interacting nuclear protein NIP30-domain-containing protein [Umbelopsis sp. AD052]
MSFNISSSFVSREILDEQGNAKQIEWDKVRSEAEQEDTNTNVPSEPYDPRTLYERLQEQKTMKEDALKEAMRFSNLVKRVDDEEMEYYRTLGDTQFQAELEKKRQEMKELEEYRQAVGQASGPAPVVSLTKKDSGENVKKDTPTVIKAQTKNNKSTKDLLQGVVVSKKRKGDDKSDAKDEKSAKRKHVDSKEETVNKEEKNVTKPPTTQQPPIQSLVAYGDDSSSDED